MALLQQVCPAPDVPSPASVRSAGQGGKTGIRTELGSEMGYWTFGRLPARGSASRLTRNGFGARLEVGARTTRSAASHLLGKRYHGLWETLENSAARTQEFLAPNSNGRGLSLLTSQFAAAVERARTRGYAS
jgi:hypothetical protein